MTKLLRSPSARVAAVVLFAALLAACSDSSNGADGAPGDDADSGVVVDPDVQPDVPVEPFNIAMHPPLTVVPDQGGTRLAHPQLVVITYADDPNRATLEQHAVWLAGSSWLTTVGMEYGVGSGTVLGTVRRTDNAPATMTDTQIQAVINAGLTDHSLPVAADGTSTDVLYIVYFPQHTAITQTSPGGAAQRSCEAFGGYHFEVRRPFHYSYAVIPNCPGFGGGNLSPIEYEELAVSHEVIEAATDALPESFPAFTLDQNGLSPWLLVGGEVGDLCALQPNEVREGNFVAQRVWSNAAATAGDRDPCQPVDPAVPYYTVTPDLAEIQMVAAGGTATFDLAAWSTAAVAPWMIRTSDSGTFSPSVSLSAQRVNNGDHATLTVRVPAGTPSRSYAVIYVFSLRSMTAYNVTPVGVYVP